MCIVVFTFIHNGLYMIKQNLTLNSLMWVLLMLTPITCKHCIDHHVVNNVCPTCDLILPSSPLQAMQQLSQVCTVCSHQQKQWQCLMLVNHIAMNDVTALLYTLYVTMDHGLLYLSYRVLMSKYLHLHMQFISCLLYPLFPVLSFSTMSLYGLWLLHMRLLILAAMIQSSLVLGKCRTLWVTVS